jgi:hypothetical protein
VIGARSPPWRRKPCCSLRSRSVRSCTQDVFSVGVGPLVAEPVAWSSVAPSSCAGEFRVVSWCKASLRPSLWETPEPRCRASAATAAERQSQAKSLFSNVVSIAKNDQLNDLAAMGCEVEGKN